ncbi:hypothetical protein SCHPADRAFT_335487 [Schizopora paradoxa]|uniref:Uncharacterized protein n=1 Tax=Schizopora paradoxa TaxID=27342 RepID=A0A0H2RX79_9AGAM|nr:hypothetical protein SCHPADRAFT_335487 [Schizopora paradoxa]
MLCHLISLPPPILMVAKKFLSRFETINCRYFYAFLSARSRCSPAEIYQLRRDLRPRWLQKDLFPLHAGKVGSAFPFDVDPTSCDRLIHWILFHAKSDLDRRKARLARVHPSSHSVQGFDQRHGLCAR